MARQPGLVSDPGVSSDVDGGRWSRDIITEGVRLA
jgi:hypothetical protein